MKPHYFVALTVPIALAASCEKDGAAEAGAEPPAPTHPWDWVPAEPELVTGRSVYQAECALCHNEGEEGAPELTNASEWAAREAKGLPLLIEHAINGFTGEDGEMPARGGTDSLTDAEVTSAVKYMLATPK